MRLAGAVLIEQYDEWEVGDRRYVSSSSMLELTAMNTPADPIDEAITLPEFGAT